MNQASTADLRAEHLGVTRMLDIMESMADRARRGEGVDSDDLEQTLEFLRVFVDKCHHTKEEELLFPAIRAANITFAEDVVEGLLADHAQGRVTVARIDSVALRLEEADESGNADLAEAMSAYSALLRAHIRREEDSCFDVADRELPAAVQTELAEGYDRIERDVVGGGVHEAFHALLDRLGSTYRA